ncbi:hypothetical protein DVA67_003350 [Solirubrobacter sp. CPCC 204708]|uniref:M14 family zinc carboxypeptidase n=1 Tax=Solirubrobacter deserti TaxID=2282478 RepID=A0ABT4RN53_9ACTN|nr:M14 family zinc carboxypeptidase [Solirubrobacter deserti]MBE2314995.1 hypothetical protein [Solirubrobacter deserti]MDA0139910.1 M14 family zinc carboxypeptidase [Solirubrobacter deserti]
MRRALGCALAVLACTAGEAGAQIVAPPWCGTVEPDAAAALPDGTRAGDPAGSFPHIPAYAIGCTLDKIAAASNGRMKVEEVGRSVQGRPLYLATIDARETEAQRTASDNYKAIRATQLSDPAASLAKLAAAGDAVKAPALFQGSIHGNEFQGTDAVLMQLERLATTPRGTDPVVDRILDHTIVGALVNINPDGRVAGTRANADGFDMNRDYLIQSQPEMQVSTRVMREWSAPIFVDLHGYFTPAMLGGPTKPHSEAVEYDLFLKWNQLRLDRTEAAFNAAGFQLQRPINDWCSTGQPPASGVCPNGETPGPDVAEGLDDQAPHFSAIYGEVTGLDASTFETCQTEACGGRLGARRQGEIMIDTTLRHLADERVALLRDTLEVARRGVAGAARPECCPAPFDTDHNWMVEYPTAFVIPVGAGQRSDAEANRLVRWLLENQVEVHTLNAAASFGGQTFAAGSYVVPMKQARRGMAHTALSVGTDISARISRVYAPPTAWSLGYLWGADTVTIPAGASFSPASTKITAPVPAGSGVSGSGEMTVLTVNSPSAIRTLNATLAAGVGGYRTGDGRVAFRGEPDALVAAAAANEVRLVRATASSLGALEQITRVPRIAVMTAAPNQETWALERLGYVADAVGTAALNGAVDPLAGYDTIFNSGTWPTGTANAVARTRLSAFFARGGGYVGGGTSAGAFLASAGEVAGLTTANRSGNGRSGIINWVRAPFSPITGAYPARDTAIVDPPVWFTSMPSSWAVDGSLPESDFLAAGLWPDDAQSLSAPGSAVIAHGLNTAGTSRQAVFAMNPLYRAIPEREWPMLAAALNWSAAGPDVVSEALATGVVSGTVPATLSLSLGAAATFPPFVPGVEEDYEAGTTAKVISTAGDAALSVSQPGHMTNGAFTLAEPLRVSFSKAAWTGPVSNESVDVTFRQRIKRTDPLRTGTYSRTVTFTLSTTSP